jgi:ERCC4-related helicase
MEGWRVMTKTRKAAEIIASILAKAGTRWQEKFFVGQRTREEGNSRQKEPVKVSRGGKIRKIGKIGERVLVSERQSMYKHVN